MGDSAAVGYIIGDKIKAASNHYEQHAENLIFMIALNGFDWFKDQIDVHPGGFTNLASVNDQIFKGIEFFTGIDYTARGDGRRPITDPEQVEYLLLTDGKKVFTYENEQLIKTNLIDKKKQLKMVFNVKKK